MGEGAVSFAVTNTSGRALRGEASVIASAPAAAWLSVDGEAQRDFPIGGTQQYLVKIAVPANAPAGQYTFHLMERGIKDPDEDYAQSADIAFVVQAPPPVAEKPAFPWWIIAAAVAVVLVIGGIVAFLLLRNVSVPSVLGKPLPDAQATLQASSLAVGTVTPRVGPAATPQNIVVEQVPTPGASVGRNSPVNLGVSRPPISASENDAFANAFALTVPASVVGSTTGANVESGEPVHAADSRCFIISTHRYLSTVWFRFQPTTSGTARISTANPGTNFDTAVSVYTGTALPSLAQAACDNNGDGQAGDNTLPGGPRTPTFSSIVHVPVTAGQVYLVQLAGIGGATSGDYNLSINME